MDTTLWVRLQAAADGGLPRGARLRERAEVDTRDRPVDFDGQRAPPLRQRGADLGLDGGGVVLPQPVPDVVLPDQALRVLGLVPRYQTRRAMLCGRAVLSEGDISFVSSSPRRLRRLVAGISCPAAVRTQPTESGAQPTAVDGQPTLVRR